MSSVEIEIGNVASVTRSMTTHLAGMKKECAKAAERATHRTLAQVRTEALHIVKENYTASTRDIREGSKIVVSPGATSAYLRLHGPRGVPLSFFAPRPARRPDWRGVPVRSRKPAAGVSSQVRRGERRFVARSGDYKPFWAVANGKDYLWRRTGETTLQTVRDRKTGKVRVRRAAQIEMLYGPSSLYALDDPDAHARLSRLADEVYPRRLRHELDRMLGTIR